ncbi:MAG: carboxypeptidase regulatory-like domain-containing protein [Myxococcota bacterium]
MSARAWKLVLVAVGMLHGCGDMDTHEHEVHVEAEPVDDGSNILQQGIIDCSERSDTGYRNGQSFAITVVTVDGKPVEKRTANAYYVMQQAAAQDGVSIRIVSGFRTMDQQEYLYGCYVNCNCNNCNLAARPGYSNHQSGHALDLNTSTGGVLNWLNNHGAAYGFERTVPSENWHWEWWGGGPGGGPCDDGGGGGGGGARRLVGVVYNAAEGTSARIQGATVRLLRNGQEVDTATSNDTGFWAFNVDAGDYTVEAHKDGFQDNSRSASASQDGDNWASIGLTPAATTVTGIYRGVIYSGANVGEDPVAGATITLSNGQTAVSSSTGAFLFELPPGEITATATKDGYTTATVTRTVTANQTIWGSMRITQVSTVVEPIPVPSIISPALDTVVEGEGVTLQFTRVAHSQHPDISYEVELYAGTTTTGTPVMSLTSAQGADAVIVVGVPVPLAAGAYAWRVRAVDPDEDGPWSNAATFSVREPAAGTSTSSSSSSSSSTGGTSTSTSSSGGRSSSSGTPEENTRPSSSSSSGGIVDEERPPEQEPAPVTTSDEGDESAATGCSASHAPQRGLAGGFALLGLVLICSRRRR